MSAITVSFVVWKESWRRAQRCCCTSSARSDNQTSSCIPLGRFGTTTIHDIGGQAWVAPCPACGKAEAAKELREAAILAPLVPFDDGTRLWRAFELGQPGAAIDCTAALRAGAVHRAAVTSSLGHGRRSPRGAWRSQCTAARARHARLRTTPAYFAPSVITCCTATESARPGLRSLPVRRTRCSTRCSCTQRLARRRQPPMPCERS